ncbi:uncharacterized protein LOC134231225 [Saccostrea cucullata]|uniref:uncharacterized protein LOC134231225 n=1 Tax=Saccostrea cuccullata TaxID=36930 RepID=UPI002ED553ED
MDKLMKPVFLKDSELPKSNNERITNFGLLDAVSVTIGDTVKCVQLERDLWRIYLNDKQSRDKLIIDGFDLNNQHVRVYESNPYSAGLTDPEDPVLKVTICGIPLSVDDSAIHDMLKKLGVHPKSEIKFEKIRNPTTNKMTNVLNGNRFLYIEPLEQNKALPRFSYCAGLRCKIFHRGQNFEKPPITCTNCWETGHSFKLCQNNPRCSACKDAGHKPGSDLCPQYIEDNSKEVEAFDGQENVISNFFACDLKVFGETFNSAEQAFQVTKAVRAGDLMAAEKIRAAKSALECKQIGKSVQASGSWQQDAPKIMEEIVLEKVKQVSEMKKRIIQIYTNEKIFAHSVYDQYWGTGLNSTQTLHTKPKAWPGQNVMGKILQHVAESLQQNTQRTGSRTRKGNANKSEQKDLDGFVKKSGNTLC